MDTAAGRLCHVTPSPLVAPATAAPVVPAEQAVAALPALVAVSNAHADAVADAKRRWLQACADGSSPASVQWLYDEYRDLVIAQVAAVVQGGPATAS